MFRYWIAVLLLIAAGPLLAADGDLGRQKAQACAMCHGPMGLSTHPAAPNLAGQPMGYLVEQLKNYRNGKRTNPVMSVIAQPLQDDEIYALASWYASIRVEIVEP